MKCSRFLSIALLLVLEAGIFPLALAAPSGVPSEQSSGCFLYRESPLYCFDIPATEAQAECEGYDDCTLADNFFPGLSCSDDQLASYCDEIMCTSSCELMFAGQCLGGVVPPGEEDQWCLPGCCQFAYFDSDYCQSTNTKWDCQSEALNKGAAEFRFDSSLTADSCDTFCASESTLPVSSEPSSFESLLLEIPPHLKSLSKNSVEENRATNASRPNQSADSSVPTVIFLLVGLGLIIGGVWLFYYFRTHTFNFEGIQPLFSRRSQDEKSRLDAALFSPFSSGSEVRARIEALRHRHQSHRKEQMKIESLQGFDLFRDGNTQNIDALKKVVEARRREAQQSFRRLQKLASKPKSK